MSSCKDSGKTHPSRSLRKYQFTTMALQKVNHHFASSLSRKKPCHHSVLVAVVLSQAYDTVDHEFLLNDILHLELSDTLIKFLCGRQQYTISSCQAGSTSSRSTITTPLQTLKEHHPTPPENIRIVSYADYCQVLNLGLNIEATFNEINLYLDQLSNWFKDCSIEISTQKSMATVLTIFRNECKTTLRSSIKGNLVWTVKHPKILCVTYDTMHNFGQHAATIKSKVSKCNNMLKCLAQTKWRKSL